MKDKTIVASLRFPSDTYGKIKKIALAEHRNISQQIVYLCEKAMLGEQEKKEEVEVGE